MSVFEYIMFGILGILFIVMLIANVIVKLNEIKIAKLTYEELKRLEEGEKNGF